jgi:ZIP family zinc transporter
LLLGSFQHLFVNFENKTELFMDTSNILYALLLTAFAGLSTGIGSAIAFLARSTNTKLLTVSLGFSAGVMIYISFVEIFTEAKESFIGNFGDFYGTLYTISGFFGGMLLIALIDKFIPTIENPHEMHSIEEMQGENPKDGERYKKLYRMGILTALAVAIHNFPEGIATFMTALNDPTVGIAIAVAVAIHNIPEGIAVSVPIFYATGNRKKAFLYSFLSGLAEPVGALLAYLLLIPFLTAGNTQIVFATTMAAVAGIMVFISLDELLPSAEEYGEHHWGIYGLIGGMVVMAISLLLLN